MESLNNCFSLRDEIAMTVVLGLMSREDQTGYNPKFIASYAYEIADAFLLQRDNRLKNKVKPIIKTKDDNNVSKKEIIRNLMNIISD